MIHVAIKIIASRKMQVTFNKATQVYLKYLNFEAERLVSFSHGTDEHVYY